MGIGVLFAVLVYFYRVSADIPQRSHQPVLRSGRLYVPYDNEKIVEAFRLRTSGLMVESQGTVERILPDDRKGSAHQRFIVRLDNGHTLLISHNIDIAPRVYDLKDGDTVLFRGQYEWNLQGGAVHWTHHDPDGRHPGGWLEHNKRRYE